MKTLILEREIFVRKASLALLLILNFIIFSCDDDEPQALEPFEIELEQLKQAVDRFKDIDVAKAEGYDVDVTGYRKGMGHHFLKASILDGSFEITKPEVLLYVPNNGGGWDFVAVEYGIPIADLDNPQPAPEGFTGDQDVWEISEEFSLWTLHAWIVMENPEGVFAPMNPKLP
ncbi:MAG: hypothetical protein AB3N14_06395 [Flavobacteriaceae bacterium]